MSDAAAPDKTDVAAAGLAAKPSKVVPIILVVNSLLLAGVLARSFLAPAAAPPAEAGAAKAGEHGEGGEHGGGKGVPGLGPTVRLPDFVVHLGNTDSERYAKMAFELELGAETDKDKVTAAMPKIRELFIAYLSDRTTDDLRGSEGIDKTKHDLLTRLNEKLPTISIKGVFITEIVVQ
jgi:flagellar FliL protein